MSVVLVLNVWWGKLGVLVRCCVLVGMEKVLLC